MKRAMSVSGWTAVHDRRMRRAHDDLIQAEAVLAAALLREFPEMTRDGAEE